MHDEASTPLHGVNPSQQLHSPTSPELLDRHRPFHSLGFLPRCLPAIEIAASIGGGGWGVKGRPPWVSPSADKPADPVMMPKALAPCSALLRDVRPRGQGASTGHGGGRAGKRCGCESCDPSRSGFHAPRPPSPSRSSHRRVLQRVSVGVVCLSLSLPGCG